MNRPLILTVLLTLASAPTSAMAAIPAVQVNRDVLTVTCSDPQLPSQAEVGRVLGTDNLSATYAARSRLMVGVRQACKGGASRLLVRRDPDNAQLVVLAMR